MSRHLHIAVAAMMAGFVAAGCVSSGTFEKMEAGKDQEIAALQKQKADLEGQKKDCEEQKKGCEEQKKGLEDRSSRLEQDNRAQKQQLDAMAQQNSFLQKTKGGLEREKEALLAASQQRQKQYDALMQGLAKEVEKGQLQVRQYQNMLTVDLAEKIFFDSGKATLKKQGKEVLKKVGEALKGYDDKIIRVVGHTDNVPMAKSLQAAFPTNWELSVARATNVVRYLQEVGIPPEIMIPAGRGEYEPVAPNDTPEGRQKNRRIEIMLIDKSLVTELTRTAN
jgi:chemotaxis protein MotB